MRNRIIRFFKAPHFPEDEEKTHQARALNALHLNMGGAILFLGVLGILFFFQEKVITSAILFIGICIVLLGMILNRRGQVLAGALSLLVFLWCLTILMTMLSGGIRSIDILFFVSGTVIAGIPLGARGALFYAGWSLLSGLGLILLENLGF